MASLKSIAVAAFVAAAMAAVMAQEPKQDSDKQSFRFRSGVDLINVTATVSDGQGRFVSGLKQEDFRIYEDGQQRPITHFTSERVPVSLGIVLDTSGSMEGEKILAAKQALQHLLFDLLGPEDEVFLYRFDNKPRKVHGWTTDRESIWSELRRIQPNGATTLYDAIAETLPVVATGRHRKKALLIISDGNDTNSYTRISELKALIHESETLVYAIGIDGFAYRTSQPAQQPWYRRCIRRCIRRCPPCWHSAGPVRGLVPSPSRCHGPAVLEDLAPIPEDDRVRPCRIHEDPSRIRATRGLSPGILRRCLASAAGAATSR